MKSNSMRLLAALVALTSAAVGAPASATVMIATYSGILTSGFDYSGEFGPANTDLTGSHFIAQYIYDPEAAAVRDTSSGDSIWGGAAYGTAAPLSDASITINGITHHIDPSWNSGANTVNNTAVGEVDDYVQSVTTLPNGFTEDQLRNYDFNILIPNSLDARITLTNQLATPYQNFFQIGNSNTNFQNHIDAYGSEDYGNITYSVTWASSVPEPTAWALMVLGLGLAGAVARRRRPLQTANV